MSKKYTLTECYELLQADPKTFRRWLKKAGIHEQVKSQISKADDRVKYLTQEQLEEIAALHERELPVVDAQVEETAERSGTPETQPQVEDNTKQSEKIEEPALSVAQHTQSEETAKAEEAAEAVPHQRKKQGQHAQKGSTKKIGIKPGTYKLMVDQLDELQQLQKESSSLALATQKALSEQETIYQQSLELLQASAQEKITAMERAMHVQQEQYESLTALLGNQLGQFDQFKISQEGNEQAQNQQIHRLEELVVQCQHGMDRSLNALRKEMAQQKEQVHAAILQTRQEIEMQIVQKNNEQKLGIHTLGEQINGDIITLMEKLNTTTEQLHEELHEEIEARKQLAKQVAANKRPAPVPARPARQDAAAAKTVSNE